MGTNMIGMWYLLLFVPLVSGTEEWSYSGDNGPSFWSDDFPDCGHSLQSPIDIVNQDCHYDDSLSEFMLTGYNSVPSGSQCVLSNTNYNAELSLTVPGASVSGGPLPTSYIPHKIQFHWGSTNIQGSEHTVNGNRYPMEMHITHYSSQYQTMNDAMDQNEGLFIMGIFFEVANHNEAFDDIIDHLRDITMDGSSFSLEPFALDSLLPSGLASYWTYKGSLTSPSCYESVIWAVFHMPVEISDSQLMAFRALMHNVNEVIVDNYRPVQPMNNRTVYSSVAPVMGEAIESHGWEYSGPHGPSHWSDDYPICAHSSQSPIDIVPNDAVYNGGLGSFNLVGYDDVPDHATYVMSNNGHTIAVALSPDGAYVTSGGGLPRPYNAVQFHFHWGSTSSIGSEHTVDGKSYPMEVHIVHYSTEYDDVLEALPEKEGLAVLGWFFEIGEHNDAFDQIVNHLPDVTYNGNLKIMPAFPLMSLLPSDMTSFWRYNGSLTTPGCFESVIWTVFKEPIRISSAQLAAFRKLVFNKPGDDAVASYMVDTYRPVQPLNNRTVYASFRTGAAIDDVSDTNAVCRNNNQSPINLVPTSAVYRATLNEFDLTSYSTVPNNAEYTISNDGHTVSVAVSPHDAYTISRGGLPGSYKAYKLRFFWGSKDSHGSEHTVFGKGYPMELQILHYSANYNQVDEAAAEEEGLAILGFFFEIGSHNDDFENIVEGVREVTYNGDSSTLTPFALDSILPTDLTAYWRYTGNDKCDESVIWSIFKEPIVISQEQMDAFRSVVVNERGNDVGASRMADNNRAVKPLNGRTVYASFRVKGAALDTYGWEYVGNRGPSYWKNDYALCGGKSQSPINIVPKEAKYKKELGEFTFDGYDAVPEGAKYVMSNNGHNVAVTLSPDGRYILSGGGLPRHYKAIQFHFHWGGTNAVGSEHTVDDKTYPMELHIVHYSGNYKTVGDALQEDEGLAVLGVFIEVGAYNAKFDAIVEYLGNIIYKDDITVIGTFPLNDLLPEDIKAFWRYSGSLTTPGCYESVIWTVFQKPIQISQEQLEQFRALVYNKKGDAVVASPMIDTYRPPLPLNGREVFSSISTTDEHEDFNRVGINSAAGVNYYTSVLMSILFIIAYAKL